MTILALNPVVLTVMAIVGAVALLTAGFILAYKKSETFRNIVDGVFAAVKGYVEIVVNYLKGPLMAAWDIVSGAIDAISALIRGDFGAAWEGLKTMIGGVVEWIKTTILALPILLLGYARDIGTAIVNGIVSGVATLGEMTWDAIKGVAGYLLNKAGEWLVTLASIGGSVVSYVVSGVTGLGADIWDKISGIGEYLLDKIKGVAGGFKDIGTAIGEWIVNAAKGAVAGLGDILKSAVLAPIRFIASKIKDNWPDLPGLPGPPGFLDTLSRVGLGATGGIVTRPTLAVIGEAGPEAVIPLNQTPGSSPLGTMGMGSGITINVQAGLVSTPDQIGQQIIEAIQNAQRRSGPVFAAA
jgi:phage-related protein